MRAWSSAVRVRVAVVAIPPASGTASRSMEGARSRGCRRARGESTRIAGARCSSRRSPVSWNGSGTSGSRSSRLSCWRPLRGSLTAACSSCSSCRRQGDVTSSYGWGRGWADSWCRRCRRENGWGSSSPAPARVAPVASAPALLLLARVLRRRCYRWDSSSSWNNRSSHGRSCSHRRDQRSNSSRSWLLLLTLTSPALLLHLAFFLGLLLCNNRLHGWAW